MFVSEKDSVKCAFCNCAPVQHESEESELSLTHGLDKEVTPRIQDSKLMVSNSQQKTPNKNADKEFEGRI